MGKLTHDAYLRLLDAARDESRKNKTARCPLCQKMRRPKNLKGTTLVSDHDHKTGISRGRICTFCNLVLGQVNDDPETLRRMADYLEAKGIPALRRR